MLKNRTYLGELKSRGGWVLGTRDQKFSFALVSANTNSMTYLTDTENFNLNEWYYVTATYNGSAMKLFVNGELKATSLDQSGDIVYAGLASDWFGIGSYVDENENWLHDGALDQAMELVAGGGECGGGIGHLRHHPCRTRIIART